MTITDRLLTPGVHHGRSGRPMTPRGVVVHYVGNPGSSAEGNRNWFENGSGGAHVSAHYVVGLNGEILRCLPDDECGAHAGKSYGNAYNEMARTNNSRFIGIECCHPTADGKFNELTYAALIELCADLCRKYGLNPETELYRHYDVTGKSCPLYYVRNQEAWRQMKEDIKARCESSANCTTAGSANCTTAGEKPTQTMVPEARSTTHDILAAPTVAVEQMQEWARNKNAALFFVDLAGLFYSAAVSIGVDPAVAYAQAALETGFGRFGGVIDETYCNPCGMKTTMGGADDDPSAHMRFRNWEEGITAQIDHLALYAGAPGYPKMETHDPRHFPPLHGKAKTAAALGGWATNGAYAQQLTGMIAELKAMVKTEAVAPWAAQAWAWGKEKKICDGTRPTEAITRQEVVMMLWNYGNIGN